MLLEQAQPDADAQDVHLPSGVIDVVFAIDLEACCLEQISDGGAIRCVAPMSDVQWAGWICRDELEQNVGFWPDCLVAVTASLLQNVRQFIMQCFATYPKVDKAGSGDLDLVDKFARRHLIDDHRRNIARILAKRFRETHRDVGREVAVLRVAGTFDRGPDRRHFRHLCEVRQAGDGLLYKLCDAALQLRSRGWLRGMAPLRARRSGRFKLAKQCAKDQSAPPDAAKYTNSDGLGRAPTVW